jgi:hypothetical protein
MRMPDISALFHRIVARVVREAIGYGICAVSAIAILILATWASVLALLPVVGPVYAQLIVAGFFALVIGSTLLWLQVARARPRPQAAATAPPAFGAAGNSQRQVQFAQIAMIVEAVMLGYSMSRRR